MAKTQFGQALYDVLDDTLDLLGIGSARRDREYQTQEAQRQMDFQTSSMKLQNEMNMQQMNHAMQLNLNAERDKYAYAVEGLKNAGLNPALAFGTGSPSVSPVGVSSQPGAKGSGSSAGVGILLQAMSSMMNSASKIAKYS